MTAMASLDFLLPGDPLSATGGYEYDRRMIGCLRDSGWQVSVRSLDSHFPFPDPDALNDADRTLAGIADGSRVLIDGLALGAMPDVVLKHAQRLRLIGLVHHPLAAETGLSALQVAHFQASERRALQAMRMVIVTSQATRLALADYGVAAHRIAVVEPGVDQPHDLELAQAPEDIRDSGTATVRLLCVATITPRKGHALLVEALAALRGRDWTLQCVGDLTRSEVTTSVLRQQIAAAGLDDRVTLTGKVDDEELRRQFFAADVFVLATRYEGYGMVIAQALTHGLPIVSTRTGAIGELVSSHAGLLVAPDSCDELRQALAKILTDEGVRRRLAAGALGIGRHLPGWPSASERFAAALLTAAAP